MSLKNTEQIHPRPVSNLGVWEIDELCFKVYGISVDGKEIPKAIVNRAYAFTQSEVPALVKREGQDNGLGFVIIHCGELGVSVLAHWWIQGSVLCQHIQRTLWDCDKPMDTADRPVIACVWELSLINAEQIIWRDTMMNDKPNPKAYLEMQTGLDEA